LPQRERKQTLAAVERDRHNERLADAAEIERKVPTLRSVCLSLQHPLAEYSATKPPPSVPSGQSGPWKFPPGFCSEIEMGWRWCNRPELNEQVIDLQMHALTQAWNHLSEL
jgi:hypothetical protein